MKKFTPPDGITRSLAVAEGEGPLEHLARIGDEVRRPIKVTRHQDAPLDSAEALTAEELADLKRESEAKGHAAMALLAAKKKKKRKA